IPVSAMSAQVTATAQQAVAPKPKCQATHAERRPVISSPAGERTDIPARPAAQRPRGASQLTTGMLCAGLMGVLQAGQAERGVARVKRSARGTAGAAVRPAGGGEGGGGGA